MQVGQLGAVPHASRAAASHQEVKDFELPPRQPHRMALILRWAHGRTLPESLCLVNVFVEPGPQ